MARRHDAEDDEQLDVAAIRTRLGLSQAQFARRFGVSVGTVRGWEQGRRVPDGPARALLRVIAAEPEAANPEALVARRSAMQVQMEMMATAARNLVRIARDPQPGENAAEAVDYLRGTLPLLRQHAELGPLIAEIEAAVADAPPNPKLMGVVELAEHGIYAVVEFMDLAVTWHSPGARVEVVDPRLDPLPAPVDKRDIRRAYANRLDPDRLPPNHYLARIRQS
jgi:putative transcriptional regulator